MKKILLILLISVIGITVSAQNKIAKIEFETKVIDYGTIEKGANGEKTFVFTNTGEAPLIIDEVKTTCSCTISKYTNQPVMPGEKGIVTITYDTRKVSPIRKTITVISNAETPAVALTIKGRVVNNSSK